MIESWQLLSVDVKTGNFSLLLYFCVVEPPLINLFGRRSYVIICLFGEVGIYDVVNRSLIYKNHFLRFYFALTPFGRTDTKLLVVVELQRKHFIGVVATSHNVSNHQICLLLQGLKVSYFVYKSQMLNGANFGKSKQTKKLDLVDVLCVIPKTQIWPKLVMRLFNEFLNIVQVRQWFDLRIFLWWCYVIVCTIKVSSFSEC